ncbi:MAG TPA: L,D-transpeptidase [Oculatellaceae cyanobacterium]|jgi:L,D-transpeptidase ErfK/SrfK
MAGLRSNVKLYAMMVALTLNLGFGFGVSAAPAASAETTHPEVTKLVINIPSRTLWVYSGDRIVRYFPVGVGRPGYMTPLGQYKITHKVLEPGWEHPYVGRGKIRIPPGEGNPLGTRWMGFHYYKNGEYGIHGTDRPSSVGQFSSHGCVRMKIKDAETLFDMVEVGTPVEVTYQTVLVRPKGNEMRIVVYPDVFKRGMPDAEKVINDIRRQYPYAKVDPEKIRQALANPLQQPIAVGLTRDDTMTAMDKPPVPPQSSAPSSEVVSASNSGKELEPFDRETQSSMHEHLE